MAINPKIKQKAEDIRKKIFGSEVRESLASGIEAISEDVEATIGRQSYVEEQFQDVLDETTGKDVISAPELIAARNGKSNLKTRLDDEHAQVTAQLQQTEQNLNAQLADKVGGEVKLEPEEFSDRALALLTGNATVNILSEPQNKSVSPSKMVDVYRRAFSILGGELSVLIGDILEYGSEEISDTRLRTTFVYLPEGSRIELSASQYEFVLYRYADANGKPFLDMPRPAWSSSSFTTVMAGFYRIKLRKPDDAVMTATDVVNVQAQLIVTPSQFSGNKLQPGSVSTTQLSAYLNKKINVMDNLLMNKSEISLEQGDISTTGGNIVYQIRIRSGFIPMNAGDSLSLNGSTYQYVLYLYSDADENTYLNQPVPEWTSSAFTAVEDGYYRIKFKRTDNSVITAGDIPVILDNLNLFSTIFLLRGGSLQDGTVDDRKLTPGLRDKLSRNLSREILSRKTTVSDTITFKSGSASHLMIDEDRGIAYSSYLASRVEEGETRDIVALTVFPILQPDRAEHFIVAELGVHIGDQGQAFINPFEPNILQLPDRIRIFFVPKEYNLNSSYNNAYFYRDFIKATRTFENPKPVAVRFSEDGTSKILNRATMSEFVTSQGFPSVPGEYPPILTTRFITDGGLHYASMTSEFEYPIIFSTVDGSEFLFRGVVPQIANYECQIEILEGTMYALNRSTTNNFYKSSDLGRSFELAGALTMSSTRPQIIKYKNKLMIIHSTALEPSDDYKALSTRINMVVRLGEGENPDQYPVKMELQSKYGIVYPSLYNYKGDIYLTYSNGELYHSTNDQGKDAIHFLKLGEFYEDRDFSIQV